MGIPGKRWPRGATNANERGNTDDRRKRRAWLLLTYESDQGPGTARCYRCGRVLDEDSLSVDRIVPGALGGKYTRDNIRPACLPCNSRTGGGVRGEDEEDFGPLKDGEVPF